MPTAFLDAARIGSLLDQIQRGDKSTILVPGRVPRLYSGGPSAHFIAKTGHNSTQEKVRIHLVLGGLTNLMVEILKLNFYRQFSLS